MLVARSHSSCSKDPSLAAREIADGLRGLGDGSGASAAVFFATEEYGPALERISREIASRAGIDSVVGCSAGSVVAPPGEPRPNRGISALAVSGIPQVDRFYLSGLRGRSEEHGREIGRLVATRPDVPSTVLLLADSYNLAPDELLGGFADTAGDVPVIGAGATESGSVGETSVVAHGASANNAVAGLVLRGVSPVPVRSPVYTPTGPWWTITSATANRVECLDEMPALERVLESLPESLREDPDDSLGRIQVALADADSTEAPLLRPIVGADPDRGALMVGDEVLPGMRLALAAPDPAMARGRLDVALGKLAASPSLACVLYFHSALGGEAPYGLPNLDLAYLRRDLGEMPVAGFGSYVTFAPHRGRNRFHHFSGLLAGLAPAGAISEEDLWGR